MKTLIVSILSIFMFFETAISAPVTQTNSQIQSKNQVIISYRDKTYSLKPNQELTLTIQGEHSKDPHIATAIHIRNSIPNQNADTHR